MDEFHSVSLIFDRKALFEYFKAGFEHSAGLYIIFLSLTHLRWTWHQPCESNVWPMVIFV